MITQEQIYNALRNVEDPDLKKDLVTLNMIEDLKIDGNKVSFSVVLTTPACPMKAMLENACRNAILHFVSKEAELAINMTSRVTSRPERALAGINPDRTHRKVRHQITFNRIFYGSQPAGSMAWANGFNCGKAVIQ